MSGTHLGRHVEKQFRVEHRVGHLRFGQPAEVNVLRAEVRVRRLERWEADRLAAPPAIGTRIG